MMKSKKAKELLEWLDFSTRFIDQPRRFSANEVEKLIEISELEVSGKTDLLEEKVNEFKRIYS